MKRWIVIVLFVLLAGTIIFLIVKPLRTPPGMRSETNTGKVHGISISPRSYSTEGFTEFWRLVDQSKLSVSWTGSWQEFNNESSAPYNLMRNSRQQGITPVIITTIARQSDGAYLVPYTAQSPQQIENAVLRFVQKEKPLWFGFGLEINILRDHNSQAYTNLKNLYADLYRKIKDVSPQTKVFTVWQYERLQGYQGGLFGGTADRDPQWELLADFTPSDAVAITTYPGLIFTEPSLIPHTYFTDLSQHTSLPIIITETGWFREGPSTEWRSSEAEQLAYVNRLNDLTRALSPQLILWVSLFDQDVPAPFRTMGLISRTDDPATSRLWLEWSQ